MAKEVEEAGINPIQSLFDNMSKTHDIGNMESFSKSLLDEDNRKTVFETASQKFDIGTFESFNTAIKPHLPKTGAAKFGAEVAKAAEDFLFTIPTVLGDREAESETAKFLGKHGIVGSVREGILAALPLDEKQELAARQFLSTPLLPIREWLPEKAPDDFLPDSIFGVDIKGARDVGWSITKGTARVLEGFSSPENIALIAGTAGVGIAARGGNALAQTAGRIIPAIFSIDMISQEPELIEGIVHAVEHGDADEAIELTTIAALNAGIAFAAGREALRRSVEGKNVISEEAKPYIDRMRQAMQDDNVKRKFEESAEKHSILMDEINENAAKARADEVLGEAPKNGRFKGEVGEFEETFGIPFEDAKIKATAEEGVKRIFGIGKEAVVKSKGKTLRLGRNSL